MQRSSVVFAVAFLLSACGGGGTTVTPPASTQPGSPVSGSASLAVPAHFEVVDLGANAAPAAINAENEVAGTIGSGTPFRYQNGALTKLPLPAGATGATVNDLNDSGVIVGTDGNALRWAADGSVTSLGAMANSFTSVVAIDDAGQILGLSPNDLGIAGCGGALTQFFTNAPPQDVGPNATSLASSAAGLSVIGEYTQEPGCTGTVSPARYPGFASVAVPSDFLMDELSTVVSDINSANAVIGFGATTAGLTATFYSVGNNAMEIDPPAGYNTLQGNGLNDSGWIVGTFYEAPSAVPEHAFLWANGKTIDLNALLPANCAWTLNTAADVNDSGYIVGTGTVNGAAHGFLLIPKY